MIVYQELVLQWLVPLGAAMKLPVLAVDEVQGDTPITHLAYDVVEPYIDCTPQEREKNDKLYKLVDMEWRLFIRGASRMSRVEQCREVIGWLSTVGVDALDEIPAALVRIHAPRWEMQGDKEELIVQVRLRMQDQFIRKLPLNETIDDVKWRPQENA